MAWDNIPVTLNFDHDKVIGTAHIDDDGKVLIEIPSGNLTKEVSDLLGLNNIRHFSLGFGYTKAKPSDE